MKLCTVLPLLVPLGSVDPSSNGRLEITPFIVTLVAARSSTMLLRSMLVSTEITPWTRLPVASFRAAAVGVSGIVDRDPVTVHDDDAAGGIDQAVMGDRAGPRQITVGTARIAS